VTFDHEVRKIPREVLEQDMAAHRVPVVRRYGTRIANDLIVSNDAKTDPDYFAELLELELALADQEPFVRIGAMYQCVGEKA
jgi:S-adenosylmethionine-dependent methyltransferase